MAVDRRFEAMSALVDTCRVSCRDEGFYPETEGQALRMLQYIQRYGNRGELSHCRGIRGAFPQVV